MILTSAQNSKIKLINRLRSKRGREQAARFAIDYERDLRRALDCGYSVDFVLHCPEIAELDLPADVEAHRVSIQLMPRISYRENPGGILAVMHSRPKQGLPELKQAAINHALVLVDLRVPGNIGALLRTADATGIDAIVLVDTALDLYNPNIIRSSTGACFLDNVYQLSGDEAAEYLKGGGIQLVCADVDGATDLFELEFQGRSAIVLGAEDRGLDRFWLAQADSRVKIPMAGGLSDSLNVSVSGAILMYEYYRQRQSS
ncbi:MAG: RNA methyltransferase [Chloroflexi bacterium]|nr:RNA methyltransferase [Chloroflexota bacterium]